MNDGLRPWQSSLLIHALLVAFFLLVTKLNLSPTEMIEVPIEITMPEEVQNLAEIKEKPQVVLKSVNTPQEESQKNQVREVFGASRQSYTDESVGDDQAVNAKRGNTLAKEVDNKVLLDSDVDSLPTPTEDYLVSEMPVVLSEVRPNYPKEAREKQIEGAVVLDVLVDSSGNVRQVSVIEGLDIFKQGAVEAMRKFRFKPALVDGAPVAVRIRYTLRFELEY
ncbi:MAG: TonB family protein [Bacteriovoracaceae bacterium]